MAQQFFATLDEPGNEPGGGQADITMADNDIKPNKEGDDKGKPDTEGDNHAGSEEDRGLTDATMNIADITIPDNPLRLRPRTHEIVIYDTNDADDLAYIQNRRRHVASDPWPHMDTNTHQLRSHFDGVRDRTTHRLWRFTVRPELLQWTVDRNTNHIYWCLNIPSLQDPALSSFPIASAVSHATITYAMEFTDKDDEWHSFFKTKTMMQQLLFNRKICFLLNTGGSKNHFAISRNCELHTLLVMLRERCLNTVGTIEHLACDNFHITWVDIFAHPHTA